MKEDASQGFARQLGAVARGETLTLEQVKPIEKMLRAELQRRGMLSSPPAYLGYDDFDAWNEHAISVLAVEAFEYAIVRKLRALIAKARIYGNIDGLVVRNIRNFVTGRQARADPIGSATFSNVKAAARLLCEEGEANTDKGDPYVRLWKGAKDRPLALTEDLMRPLTSIEGFYSLSVIGEPGRQVARTIWLSLLALGSVSTSDLTRHLRPYVRAAAISLGIPSDDEIGYEDDEVVALVRPFEPRDEELLELTRERAGVIRSERLRSSLLAILDLIEASDEPMRVSAMARELHIKRTTLNGHLKVLRGIVRKATQELQARS